MTTEKVFKIFVDFDGTITKIDVGDNIFQKFGNANEVNPYQESLMQGKITAFENWTNLFGLVKEWDYPQLKAFIDSVEMDETFTEFVKYCRQNGHELFVLSDGFDLYIKRILSREGLNDIKVISNAWLEDGSKAKLVFPFMDEECKDCANCKRNHIINNSGDDEFTVYIGDGTSDRCPAQYCDFVFAKSFLLKFCEKERISYSPYNNFDDVIYKLELLKKKRNLKKRRQAELKRKDCYMRG
mgnify:CR=1 FL=1